MTQLLLGGSGVIGGVIVVIVLAKFLLGSALQTLHTEIRHLRDRLEQEQTSRAASDTLRDKRLADIEKLYNEQRTEKHAINNEYTKVATLLGVIVPLAERCTCGALDIVRDLMSRVASGAGPFPGPLVEGHWPSSSTTTTTTHTENQ